MTIAASSLLALFLLLQNGRLEPTPWSGYRRTPRPDGMVFQVEARESHSIWDRFDVFPTERDGPAVGIVEPAAAGRPARLRIFSYPEGRLVEERTGPEVERALSEKLAGWKKVLSEFDFDGDGAQDLIETGIGKADGRVRVLSGRDLAVIFENIDPLEYDPRERGVKLGDLDGDGYAELAVLHPRADRSTYDPVLWDRLFGAKSWISIVSGARVAGR